MKDSEKQLKLFAKHIKHYKLNKKHLFKCLNCKNEWKLARFKSIFSYEEPCPSCRKKNNLKLKLKTLRKKLLEFQPSIEIITKSIESNKCSIIIHCKKCNSSSHYSRLNVLLSRKEPCKKCHLKRIAKQTVKTKIRRGKKKFLKEVSKKYPDFKFLTEFKGKKRKITFICSKGHKETKNAGYVLDHGCKTCGEGRKLAGENKRLKCYTYNYKFTNNPKIGFTQVLPPPYNSYKLIYKGLGGWLIMNEKRCLKPRGNVSLYGYRENKKFRVDAKIHHIIYALKINDFKILSHLTENFEIDHIDRNHQNNHPNNLRLANNFEQSRNRGVTHVKDYETHYKICKMRVEGYTLKQIAKVIKCSLDTIHLHTRGEAGKDLHQKLPLKMRKNLDKINNRTAKHLKDPEIYVNIFKDKVKNRLSNGDIRRKYKLSGATVQGILSGTYYKKWINLLPSGYLIKAEKVNKSLEKLGRNYVQKY